MFRNQGRSVFLWIGPVLLQREKRDRRFHSVLRQLRGAPTKARLFPAQLNPESLLISARLPSGRRLLSGGVRLGPMRRRRGLTFQNWLTGREASQEKKKTSPGINLQSFTFQLVLTGDRFPNRNLLE